MSNFSITLSDSLPGSSLIISIWPDGNLVFDDYDHSKSARNSLGNDVAWMVVVKPNEFAKLRAILRQMKVLSQDDESNEGFVSAFDSVFASCSQVTHETVAQWLQSQDIACRQEYAPWA